MLVHFRVFNCLAASRDSYADRDRSLDAEYARIQLVRNLVHSVLINRGNQARQRRPSEVVNRIPGFVLILFPISPVTND
jgi:hypothetical protein